VALILGQVAFLGLRIRTLGFTSLLHTYLLRRQVQNTQKRDFLSCFAILKGCSYAKSSTNRVHRSYIESLDMMVLASNTDTQVHRRGVGKMDVRAK
jgi:di/tricarboxylate transporter